MDGNHECITDALFSMRWLRNVEAMRRTVTPSINQSNLVFVKRRLNKVLRGASYE